MHRPARFASLSSSFRKNKNQCPSASPSPGKITHLGHLGRRPHCFPRRTTPRRTARCWPPPPLRGSAEKRDPHVRPEEVRLSPHHHHHHSRQCVAQAPPSKAGRRGRDPRGAPGRGAAGCPGAGSGAAGPDRRGRCSPGWSGRGRACAKGVGQSVHVFLVNKKLK